MPRYLNPPCHLKAGHQDSSQSPRRGALTFGKGLLCPTLEKQQNPEPDLAEAASALKEQETWLSAHRTVSSTQHWPARERWAPPHHLSDSSVYSCIVCVYKWLCVGLNRFATQ